MSFRKQMFCIKMTCMLPITKMMNTNIAMVSYLMVLANYFFKSSYISYPKYLLQFDHFNINIFFFDSWDFKTTFTNFKFIFTKSFRKIINSIKVTLKAFNDSKKRQQKCMNFFWYVKVYIFWKFIQYTTQWDKIQMLKKFPSNKTTVTKKCTLFPFVDSNSSQFYF